jgi:[ribosomal protein S5]-alanine N-acetyltransferase
MNHSSSNVLRIEPATVRHLELLLAGDEKGFASEFGLTLAPGYVQHQGALEHSMQTLRNGTAPQWATHLFIHSQERAVIGIGGFAHPPVNGEVEIGYSIAPSYQGAGHATSAARQLVDAARAAGLSKVVAHTLAEYGPSTRILSRLGFDQTQELEDPEDGLILRWELALRDAPTKPATT